MSPLETQPDPRSHTRPVTLPELVWRPTRACMSREGETIRRVVLHRWGVSYTTPKAEAASYAGVIRWFEDPANAASAHLVLPGSAVPGRAAQMVAWGQAAWAEAAYNRSSVEIECADAIWLGHDPRGLAVAARITAFLLAKYDLPAIWSVERGFCRHGDLGQAGGGHTACPTTDRNVFQAFAYLVKFEAHRGGFRPFRTWGR